MKAIIKEELSSKKLKHGTLKNFSFLITIGVVYYLAPAEIRTYVTWGVWLLCISQAISISENLTESGVDIPDLITEKLEVTKRRREK